MKQQKRRHRETARLILIGLFLMLSYSNCAKPFATLEQPENFSLADSVTSGTSSTTISSTTIPGASTSTTLPTTTSTTSTVPGATTTSTTVPPASPPPPGTDLWMKLPSAPNVGPFNPYFYCPVVRASTGEILVGWGKAFIFKPGTGWAVTSKSAAGSGASVDMGKRENYGCSYDEDQDVAWIGDGAPVAYGFPGGLQSGELTYSFATETFTLEHKNYTTPSESISTGDGAFVYWKNMLWKFGGFSVNPSQATASLDLVTKKITVYSAANISNPPWTDADASSRVVYARSGILNKSTGSFWTLADNNELWIRDMTTGQWTLIPTSGSKPSSKFIVADYDETNNVILAWAGTDSVVGVTPVVQVRATWVLDMNTKVWRKSLNAAAGHVVPPGVAEAGNVIRYDRYNKRMIMTVGAGYTEVWAFYLGTPPP